jgi:hypothetical protein
MGIEFASAPESVALDASGLYLRIGFVVIYDGGPVEAVSYFGATAPQIGEIIRQAELACMNGPAESQWRRVNDQGWEAVVLEPVGVPHVRRSPHVAHHLIAPALNRGM